MPHCYPQPVPHDHQPQPAPHDCRPSSVPCDHHPQCTPLISDVYPVPRLLTFTSTSGATPPTQHGQRVPLPAAPVGDWHLVTRSFQPHPGALLSVLDSRSLHTCQQALQAHSLTRSHPAPSSGRGAHLYLHHHQLIFLKWDLVGKTELVRLLPPAS